MHTGHHGVSQAIDLAFMRHQELIDTAQRYRLQAQVTTRPAAAVPGWRRWLGRRLVTWGRWLQAPDPLYRPLPVRGPVFTRPAYPGGSRKAT